MRSNLLFAVNKVSCTWPLSASCPHLLPRSPLLPALQLHGEASFSPPWHQDCPLQRLGTSWFCLECSSPKSLHIQLFSDFSPEWNTTSPTQQHHLSSPPNHPSTAMIYFLFSLLHHSNLFHHDLFYSTLVCPHMLLECKHSENKGPLLFFHLFIPSA